MRGISPIRSCKTPKVVQLQWKKRGTTASFTHFRSTTAAARPPVGSCTITIQTEAFGSKGLWNNSVSARCRSSSSVGSQAPVCQPATGSDGWRKQLTAPTPTNYL
jgi:hypothetical protein